MSREDRLIAFGALGGTSGLNGELKLVPLSEHAERFRRLPGTTVIWRRDGQMQVLSVQGIRQAGRFYIIAFAGFDTPQASSSLTGGDLVVPESDLLPLPEGHYYIHQMIGLSVIDQKLGNLGTLVEVLKPGSNDVYVVRGPLGEVLVPALRSVVESIDISAGVMQVRLPEGLVDASES